MENCSRKLQAAILEYVSLEAASQTYSDDRKESLEVARQCLETAWEMEATNESDLLLKLFESAQTINVPLEKHEVSEDDKKAAELLKCQGNICMGENLFDDAVSCYTKAIEIDSLNAVYFCNRAAAYSKLNKNESAISDCNHALTIDNNYSKAYSRMGLAYTAMNKFDDAIKCYKKALDIEPDNQNYKQNLQAAEEKRSYTGADEATPPSNNPSAPNPGFQSLLNNVDIGSLLNNPAMMNIAQQFMSQPDMRNMMSQMMQSVMTPTSGEPNSVPPQENASSRVDSSTPNPNVNDFLSFGQQFAQQMQSANPELVSTLRQQFQSNNPGERDPENNNEPEPRI